jgi:hypothetical protein
LAALALAAPDTAGAQATADGVWQRYRQPWMTAWSPLNRLADLGQAPPAGSPGLAAAPAPRIGLWWTAGVPAALPFELVDTRSEFHFTAAGASGPYRRAMDPDDVKVVQGSVFGWRPIGASGGAAGSIVIDQETAGARPYAATLRPYSSDPFVVADTTAPATRRVRARLEGAFGWRAGPLGFGASVGLEEGDHRTRDAGFPHFGRSSAPAARAAVAYAPHPAVRVAVYGRWLRDSETLSMGPRTMSGMVFRLAGYHDPDSGAVVGPAFFFRRSERSARAGGVAAAGRVLRTDAVAYAERTIRRNRHFSAQVADPPADRWDADGWVLGLAAQRRLVGPVLFTGQVRRETLAGDARLADLDGVVFRSSESELTLSAELRFAPAGVPWTVIAAYDLVRTRHLRYDFIAEVGADLVEWTPGVALAVMREFGRATIGLGASGADHSAVGAIPDATALGPVYQTLVAPGMTFAASRARPLRLTGSVGYRTGPATTLLLDGAWTSLDGPTSTLPFAPTGTRTAWSVGVRAVMTP